MVSWASADRSPFRVTQDEKWSVLRKKVKPPKKNETVRRPEDGPDDGRVAPFCCCTRCRPTTPPPHHQLGMDETESVALAQHVKDGPGEEQEQEQLRRQQQAHVKFTASQKARHAARQQSRCGTEYYCCRKSR